MLFVTWVGVDSRGSKKKGSAKAVELTSLAKLNTNYSSNGSNGTEPDSPRSGNG